MKRTGTSLGKAYRLTKAGTVERDPRRLDASARQRQRPGGSKKVRVARRPVTLADVLIAEELEFARAKKVRVVKRGKA